MQKTGFIGCGRMATALINGLVESGNTSGSDLLVYDVSEAATSEAAKKYGVQVAQSAADLTAAVDVVVLAVKPQDLAKVVAEEAEALSEKLVISIAAGVTIAQIQNLLRGAPRIARVMPNTPCLIGKGVSAFAMSDAATDADASTVNSLLSAVGRVYPVAESSLDAVTGLSGSGPAYVYLMIEALADGGVRCGLSRQMSLELAAGTLVGAASMVLETGEHPAALRDMVTSPGGTTAAGLEALEQNGVRAALLQAVKAATARSIDLRS